jgi:hypothetical protein
MMCFLYLLNNSSGLLRSSFSLSFSSRLDEKHESVARYRYVLVARLCHTGTGMDSSKVKKWDQDIIYANRVRAWWEYRRYNLYAVRTTLHHYDVKRKYRVFTCMYSQLFTFDRKIDKYEKSYI